jgi:hypothetical protein
MRDAVSGPLAALKVRAEAVARAGSAGRVWVAVPPRRVLLFLILALTGGLPAIAGWAGVGGRPLSLPLSLSWAGVGGRPLSLPPSLSLGRV